MKSTRRHLFLIALACTFFCFNLSAQETIGRFFLAINPLHLVNERMPALDIHAVYHLSDKYSLRINGGPAYDFAPGWEDDRSAYRGWQVGFGGRYKVIQTNSKHYSVFAELRGRHKIYHADYGGSFLRDQWVVDGLYSRFDIDVSEWNVQVGIGQAYETGNFRFEFVAAIGPAFVDIEYSGHPENFDFFYSYAIRQREYWNPTEKYKVYPHHLIELSFALGYAF